MHMHTAQAWCPWRPARLRRETRTLKHRDRGRCWKFGSRSSIIRFGNLFFGCGLQDRRVGRRSRTRLSSFFFLAYRRGGGAGVAWVSGTRGTLLWERGWCDARVTSGLFAVSEVLLLFGGFNLRVGRGDGPEWSGYGWRVSHLLII
jgi:hypothetical protein